MDDLDVQIPIERLDDVDSTNRYARRAIEAGEVGDHPRMIVATRQTSGQGRFGRPWSSPEGGLWCTLIWPITLDPQRVIEGLALRVGLACAHAVEHVLAAHGHGDDVELKWPNDVLIEGRKVLGVLIEIVERSGRPYALVGVGVNADFPGRDLPDELQGSSTTLRDVIGGPVNLERLVRDLRVRLRDALMEEGLSEEQLNDVRNHLAGVGHHAEVTLGSGARKSGELLGVDDRGRLRLRTGEGEYTAPAGAAIMIE